jgi:hypothetical protein
MTREPRHDDTIVTISEYFAAVWKERATCPIVATTQIERLTADYTRKVAESEAALWKLRADQERALAGASTKPLPNGHPPTADAGRVPPHGGHPMHSGAE